MRGDLKGRYESYGKGIQWGILSPNDCANWKMRILAKAATSTSPQ